MTIAHRSETMAILDFNRMTNKYIMDTEADARDKIMMLSSIITRLDDFDAYEAQTR